MKHCPHEHIQFCPLYVAGHEAGLPTCCVKWDWEGCDVMHGRADYGKLVAALSRVNPEMIAECAEREYQFEARRQRQRNMRAAGVH